MFTIISLVKIRMD